MKKTKASLDSKNNNDFLKKAKAQTEGIEAVNKVEGRLAASELLHGTNFARLCEALLKKATKPISPSRKETALKILLDPKTLEANAKAAPSHATLVKKQQAAALIALAKDAETAVTKAARAIGAMQDLDDLAKRYAEAGKKGAALIKASPDTSRIKRAITGILRTHKQTAKAHARAKAKPASATG